jgi:hypothetical protein
MTQRIVNLNKFHETMKQLYRTFGLNGEGEALINAVDAFLSSANTFAGDGLAQLTNMIENEATSGADSSGDLKTQAIGKKEHRLLPQRKRSKMDVAEDDVEPSGGYREWLRVYKRVLRALQRHGPFAQDGQDVSSSSSSTIVDPVMMVDMLDQENDDLQSELMKLRKHVGDTTEREAAATQAMNELRMELSTRPTHDSIAVYDIVYAFIVDLKRLTGDKHVWIEDIAEADFVERYPDVQQLLSAIDQSFTKVINGRTVPGIKRFLQVTGDVRAMHATTGHLPLEARTKVYNYQKLKALCDDEMVKVLEIVRNMPARNRDWPLAML